jgi:hypothetical protein
MKREIVILVCWAGALLCSCRCAEPHRLAPSEQLLEKGAQSMTDVVKEPSLTEYLKKPYFDPLVAQLADTAAARYQQEPLKSQHMKAKATDAPGGGRQEGWITATFGRGESEISKSLQSIDGPFTWNLASIDQAFNEAIKRAPSAAKMQVPTFTLVKGLSINYLHEYPWGKDSIVQLASQFNFLESPSTNKIPVSAYLTDSTQGPQGSIEAAAAALHRTSAEAAGKLPHALSGVFEGDSSAYYRNGYFEPGKLSTKARGEVLAIVRKNLGKLTILPQWVRCEASGTIQLQVFTAAPSFQGGQRPEEDSLEAQLCDTLVTAQYRAIAQLAVIRSIETGDVVPLHLTLAGQGAFNNPPSVMKSALTQVASVVKGRSGVRVFIHAYSDEGQMRVKSSQDTALWNLVEWTKEQFKAAPR